MHALNIALFVIIACVAVAGLVLAVFAYLRNPDDLDTLTVNGVQYPASAAKQGNAIVAQNAQSLEFGNVDAQYVDYGSTTVAAALDGKPNAATAKGDLIVGNGSASAPLTVGNNDQLLVADDAAATGMAWKNVVPSTRDVDFYVSTTGSDSNSGLTPSEPFLTFAAAVQAASGYGNYGTTTVHLGPGTFTSTVSFEMFNPLVVKGTLQVDSDFDGKVASGTQGTAPDFDTLTTVANFTADVYAGRPITVTQGASVMQGTVVSTDHASDLIRFINNTPGKPAYGAATTFQVFERSSLLDLTGTIAGDVTFEDVVLTQGTVVSENGGAFRNAELNDLTYNTATSGTFLFDRSYLNASNVNIDSSSGFIDSTVSTGGLTLSTTNVSATANALTGLIINACSGEFDNCSLPTCSVKKGSSGVFNNCAFSDTFDGDRSTVAMSACAFAVAPNDVYFSGCSVVATDVDVVVSEDSGNVTQFVQCNLRLDTVRFSGGGDNTKYVLARRSEVLILGTSTFGRSALPIIAESCEFGVTGDPVFTDVGTAYLFNAGTSAYIYAGFGAGSVMGQGIIMGSGSHVTFNGVPTVSGTATDLKIGNNANTTWATALADDAIPTVTSDFSTNGSQYCSVSKNGFLY